MKETVTTVGSHRLMGILAEPDKVDAGSPVVLIPNTGIEHRVGPNRLHVALARAFAQSGYVTLRLDLSGMGDSPPAGGGGAVQDLQAAMNELQGRGYGSRFAAVGLCSGAHDVHRLALADQRLVAAAFLDGYAYRTLRFAFTYLLQRIIDPQRVFRFARRRIAQRQFEESFDVDDVGYFHQPDRQQVQRDLDTLMRRELSMCFVYTGQLQYTYNYAEQLIDAFPGLREYPECESHYLTHCDHTFSRPAMSSDLAKLLVAWLGKSRLAKPADSVLRMNDAMAVA